MGSDKSFPLWAWIGCGCLGAFGALTLVGIALGVWGVQRARELGEAIKDPEARTEAALRVLGADALPDGYYATIALRVPHLFELAVLSDTPPDDTGRPADVRERGFVYLSYASMGFSRLRPGSRELRDFIEGRTPDLGSWHDQDVDLSLRERVAGGRIPRGDDELLWSCHRGRVDSEMGGPSADGLVTLLLIDCDEDSRQRIGIWFAPDPEPGAPADELDLTASVGDPEAIRQFMAPIRPCAR